MEKGFDINNLSGYSYILLVAGLIFISGIVIVVFSHYFTKYFFIGLINKVFGKKAGGLGRIMYKNHLFQRIAYLIPAILLYECAELFNVKTAYVTLYLADLIIIVTKIYILIDLALILSAMLNCINDRYRTYTISKQKPIKSYLQLIKIIIFVMVGVIIASILSDKSPIYILTGVSAATAVLVIVFKDSIINFISSIQLSAYDMVRIGDWIEMPNYGADGEVKDISLNTVKVQNFDKTIVTIPNYALLSSGLRNWRGMQEAGARRVKQTISIDITTIKICDKKFYEHVSRLNILKEVLTKREITKNEWATNIGVFRMYAEAYLHQHPGVHQEMRILVKQLQGTPNGLPLEIYFFTNETDSTQYEAIIADIFDHLYATLSLFELRAFQLH